jgi:hypothetical protein
MNKFKICRVIKNLKFSFLTVLIFLLTLSCSSFKEVHMPFKNMVYSGERLFPIQSSNSDFAFRVWVNNGTSIERVITFSSDSLLGNQCKLVEFGFLSKKGFNDKKIFIERDIKLKSDYSDLKQKIDSLKLFEIKTQKDFEYVLNHEPFSLYVIEIKEKEKYHQFTFKTHFPNNFNIEDNYTVIEKFLFNEFEFNFYLKD